MFCQWEAFLSLCNITLWLIGSIRNLQRKWSVRETLSISQYFFLTHIRPLCLLFSRSPSIFRSISLLDCKSSLYIYQCLTTYFHQLLSLPLYIYLYLYMSHILSFSPFLSLPLPLSLSTYISRKNMYYFTLFSLFNFFFLFLFISLLWLLFFHLSQYNLSFSSNSLSPLVPRCSEKKVL